MIKLSNRIYDDYMIKQGIRDYKAIAEIEMDADSDFYYLQFEKCKYDEERTVKEFENYLIDLTNVRSSK